MKSWIVILTLFIVALPIQHSDVPSVQIEVVKQERFNNRGHHPDINRRVTFKLTNNTGKVITIYGLKDGEIFDPAGYLVEFDNKKDRWIYPTGENSPPNFNDISSLEKSEYTLLNGESIYFVSEISLFQVGTRFCRTIYVSIQNNVDTPKEIRSPEFVLE